MTIKFVLLVNKQGQTRVAKYTDSSLTTDERRALEAEIVRKCLTRVDKQVGRLRCSWLLLAGISYYVLGGRIIAVGGCQAWLHAGQCTHWPIPAPLPFDTSFVPPPPATAVQLCGAPQLEGGVPAVCLPVFPSGHR